MTTQQPVWPPPTLAPTDHHLPPWLEVLRDTAIRVIVDPLREGAFEFKVWTPGLRIVAGLAMFATLLAALVASFGVGLRRGEMVVSANGMLLPAWSLPLLLWLTTLAMALLYSAAMHTHWAFHVVVWCVLTPMWVSTPATKAFDWLHWITGGVAVLMLVMPLLVRRRGWEAWQFVVVWLALSTAVAVPLVVSNPTRLAIDMRGIVTMSLVTTMTSIACPAIAAAGYSAIEVVVTSAQWFSHEVRDLGRRFLNRWLVALVVATGAWRAWSLGRSWADDPDSLNLVGSALVVLATLAVTWAIWSSAPIMRQDRRNVWPVGLPSTLAEHMNVWVFPLGLLMALPLYPANAFDALSKFLGKFPQASAVSAQIAAGSMSDWFRFGLRIVASLALVVFAAREARRNRPALAPLAAGVLVIQLVNIASNLPLGWRPAWSMEGIGAITSAAALGWLVLAAVRRRLHNGTLLAVWVVWLLATAYQFRDYLDEPTTIVGGVSASGLVLAGIAWRLFTDGEIAHGDSKAFPRETRVLLLLTNALFAAITLGLTALAGGYNPLSSADSWNTLGENAIGGPLLTAAMLAPFLVTWWAFGLDD